MGSREDKLTFAAAGDAFLTREVQPFEDERFRDVVRHVREADAAVVNLEVLLHDYEGYPTGTSTATYVRAPPKIADELSWMGFNLFAAATNHSFDYSHGGMEATMEALERRDLTYAGLGRNLASARAPAYQDTPAGRVALVAACSTITTGSIAGEQRRDMQGRPGISPLRHEPRYVVPEEEFEQLEALSELIGLEDLKREGQASSLSHLYVGDDEDSFELLHVDADANVRFEMGDDPGVYREADPEDVHEITSQIENADRQADWVVASHHTHEGANGRSIDQSTPEFVESFARACIDAGADAFVGHGAHVLQGIEIYDGAPIFYDLGNLFIYNQLITRLPSEIYDSYGLDDDADPVDVFDGRVFDENGEPAGFLANPNWWASVLPICEFEAGELTEVRLYPLDLMREEPRPRRGRAVMAQGDQAEAILEDLAALSEPYGTDVEILDGWGKISTS